MEQYFPFILLALAVVLLFVLPARQRKRMAAQAQAMQDSLDIGTPVMTTSGLHGSVAAIGDKTIDVEIAPGVVVTFARQAILEIRKPLATTDDVTDEGTDSGTSGRDRRTSGRRHRLSRATSMANRSLPTGRYFGAFLLIVAVLYALVFFTGSTRTPQLGLDLRGGTTVTLTARTPDGQAPAQEDLELARQIIEQRVNGLGVAEAEVVTEGDSNIVISVPGDDGDQARQLGQTAQLRFRPVVQGPEPATPAATDSATPTDAAATPTDAAAAPTDAATPTDAAAPTDRAAPTDAARRPTRRRPRSTRTRPPITQEQAALTYATLTCDSESHGLGRPPRGLRRRLQRGRRGQVPARPRRGRGHRHHRRQPRHAPGHGRVDRPAGLQLVGLRRRGPSTPAPTSASRSASRSTARSSPRRRSTRRSPAAPRSRAASTRSRRRSWPTSSSTARCR